MRLRKTLVWIWFLLVAVFVVAALASQWQRLASYDWNPNLGFLGIALVFALLRRLCGGLNFSYMLSRISKTPLWPNFTRILEIYFITNVAHYMPGTYWYIPWRMKVFLELGIRQSHTLVVSVLESLMMVLSHTLVGLALLLPFIVAKEVIDVRWLLAVVVLGFVFAHPRVIRILFRVFSKALKMPAEDPHLEVGQTVVTLLLLTVKVGLTGLSHFFILKSIYPQLEAYDLLFVTGAFALAWPIGFLTPFAPSGIGIREGLLVWFYSTLVPLPVATAAAITTRIYFIAEDAIWAALASLTSKARGLGPAPPLTADSNQDDSIHE